MTESVLPQKAKVADVIFNNNFETITENIEFNGDAYALNRMEEAAFKIDQLKNRVKEKNIADVQKTIDIASKLLENAESILADARIAYKKAIQKGREEAKVIMAKNKGNLTKIERKLRKRLKDGYHRGLCNGYEEGFALGKVVGQKEAQEQLLEACNKLEEIATYINIKQADILKEYEEDVIDLVFSIAQKVTATTLKKDENTYIKIIKAAISNLKEPKWVEIVVADSGVAKKILANENILKEAINSCESFKVNVSDNFEEGKILIETPTEFIEATPEEQIKNIRKKFKELQNE
ncbi:MAG: FliH/SctL family protein [Oscillospiraceae bacterium]